MARKKKRDPSKPKPPSKRPGYQKGKNPPTGRKAVWQESAYEQRFCQLVFDMGREGKSEQAMANACGVARSTMRAWCKDHPEFRVALTLARGAGQEWWENIGQESVIHCPTNFPTAVWNKTMSARYGYVDETTVNLQGGDPEKPIAHTIRRVFVKTPGLKDAA